MLEPTTANPSTSISSLATPLLLLAGALLIQLGFIASYVGAFHTPTPRDVPVAVVAPPGAPAEVARSSAQSLNDIAGHPLKAKVVKDAAAGRRQLKHREVAGVLILGERSDRLLVASADGQPLSAAVERVVGKVAAQQQRPLAVTDAISAGKGDADGLSPFYLAVGWVVGGYLAASLVGIVAGERVPTMRRLAVRVASMVIYSVLSGIGGALVVGPWLDALDHDIWTLAAFGTLLVLASSIFTLGAEAWLGVLGIGVAIALFVVLGNPSAGGAFPGPLLPPFFETIGPWLPPGAGTSAIRGITYFDRAGVRDPALVLTGWLVLGLVLLIVNTALRQRSHATDHRRAG